MTTTLGPRTTSTCRSSSQPRLTGGSSVAADGMLATTRTPPLLMSTLKMRRSAMRRIAEATPMEKEGRLGAPSTSFSVLLSKFYQEGGLLEFSMEVAEVFKKLAG